MPSPAAGVRTEPMTGAHAAAVLAIYQAGIEEGNATFETCAPDWTVFTAARLPAHRYVAITEGRVAGWTATSITPGMILAAAGTGQVRASRVHAALHFLGSYM